MKHKKVKGFISEYDERLLDFDDYFKAVENGEEPGALPIPVLQGIRQLIEEDDEEEIKGLRVTSLLGCIRNTYYEHKVGNNSEYVKPSDYYALFRGIIGHKVMEGVKTKGCVDEKRCYRDFMGIIIAGKPDRIIPKEKKIVDYKTTKKVPQYSNKPYSYHEQQLNIYRWLVAPEYEIDKLEVVYMDMETAKTCYARVYPLAEVEKLLEDKVLLLKDCLDNNTPPKYEKSWQCNYCSYGPECRKDLRKDLIEELADKIKKGKKVNKSDLADIINKLK